MRMAVKTINRRAQIVFENVNGQAQIDNGEIEIPYDIDRIPQFLPQSQSKESAHPL